MTGVNSPIKHESHPHRSRHKFNVSGHNTAFAITFIQNQREDAQSQSHGLSFGLSRFKLPDYGFHGPKSGNGPTVSFVEAAAELKHSEKLARMSMD